MPVPGIGISMLNVLYEANIFRALFAFVYRGWHISTGCLLQFYRLLSGRVYRAQ